MFKFRIFKGHSGFTWELMAPNGQILLSNGAYFTKESCTNAVRSVQRFGGNPKNYKMHDNVLDGYTFSLIADNGEVLAISSYYRKASDRNEVMQMIIDNARKAQGFTEKAEIPSLVEFIKDRRKKAGLTQDELAEKAGVGLRFLRELEQGKDTLRLDKVNQVLRLFGHEMTPTPTKRENI